MMSNGSHGLCGHNFLEGVIGNLPTKRYWGRLLRRSASPVKLKPFSFMTYYFITSELEIRGCSPVIGVEIEKS